MGTLRKAEDGRPNPDVFPVSPTGIFPVSPIGDPLVAALLTIPSVVSPAVNARVPSGPVALVVKRPVNDAFPLIFEIRGPDSTREISAASR